MTTSQIFCALRTFYNGVVVFCAFFFYSAIINTRYILVIWLMSRINMIQNVPYLLYWWFKWLHSCPNVPYLLSICAIFTIQTIKHFYEHFLKKKIKRYSNKCVITVMQYAFSAVLCCHLRQWQNTIKEGKNV